MFRIKICGITSSADAAVAIMAGADAIGLNFYPPSPRSLQLAQALEISAAIPAGVAKVGVFVQAPVAEMATLSEKLGLSHLQLHGDEPADLLTELAGRRVVKAFRLRSDGIEPIVAWLDRAAKLQVGPECCLLDAYRPGVYGGTGHTTDWSQAAELVRTRPNTRLILAGGLTPDNVADAIAAVRPTGVDTASGVESAPGKKDPAKVRDFVAAARDAFARL